MDKSESPLILVVDDTPINLQIAGELLGHEGYRITLAQSGLKALEFVEKTHPDLILLDVMMPDMDGFKVCRFLKDNLETRHIPVIFLTARSQIEEIVKGFELGGADYLVKPINNQELLARVKAHLELVKLQGILREKNRRLVEEMSLYRRAAASLPNSSIVAGNLKDELKNLLDVVASFQRLEIASTQEERYRALAAENFVRQLVDLVERQSAGSEFSALDTWLRVLAKSSCPPGWR